MTEINAKSYASFYNPELKQRWTAVLMLEYEEKTGTEALWKIFIQYSSETKRK